MTRGTTSTPRLLGRSQRLVLGLFCGLIAAAVVLFAWTIPFRYPSPSLLYKFGADKLLLQVGKDLGLSALLLVVLQTLLAARLRWADRLWSLNRLFAWHRWIGPAAAGFVALHALLILGVEDFVFFSFEKKYWPEWVGVFFGLSLLLLVAGAVWRFRLGLNYQSWLRLHRPLAWLLASGAVLHASTVSESFSSGPPRLLLAGVGVVLVLGFLRLRLRALLLWRQGWRVAAVNRLTARAVAVQLALPEGKKFPYLPGQFAFLSFRSAGVSAEEHPFTIASTPSRPGYLQFVIGAAGDWTAGAGRLRAGDRVRLDGPYGHFSFLLAAEQRPLVLVAGGIGITPMLSMLRFLADGGDPRPILLVWSLRNEAHLFFGDELAGLARRLPGLRQEIVFTQGREGRGRLDRNVLNILLAGSGREAAVFLCGPPAMMADIAGVLQQLGFSGSRLYREEFRF